jgi:outer membrane protein assembly factor BamA
MPVTPRDLVAASQYAGQTVEEVRIEGNTQVSTSVIRELIRTHEGDKFDPNTVVDDYQRVYDKMKLFANVEARVQPTATGVIVVFLVTEEKQIKDVRFVGNFKIKTRDLEDAVDLKAGQAIDSFRISLGQQAIEKLYHTKNHPFAHVLVDQQLLTQDGIVLFTIVEGPQVRVRKVDFIGNNSFTAARLSDQVQTPHYLFIFNSGNFDPEQVDEDVASLRRFYRDKGFFDARVGRILTRSADMTEMEVTFVIDEGPRYIIDRVEFKGDMAVTEGELRKDMHMLEGQYFEQAGEDDDIRAMVREYSKAGGYIYFSQPGLPSSEDYLYIKGTARFKSQPGHMDLVYDISEGRQFRLDNIRIKGNEATKDNVILRELHLRPGQRYDSGEVEDAADRLRGLPNFKTVTITPIDNGDPNGRDLLVEVEEQRTAEVTAGVGVNSNGGVGGQLSYEQKNFDITNPPTSFGDFFSSRAFAGAGQDFRAEFDPGTLGTDANIRFSEPYIFDQPFSITAEAYLSNRIRESYDDDRLGGTIIFGHNFNYIYSADVSMRGEDVVIKHVIDPELRAPEINQGTGHHTLTSIAVTLERDTTNHGPLTYKGDNSYVQFEQGEALGGNVDFNRVSFSMNDYQTISEDLVDRRAVIYSHLDFASDPHKAPFYERLYGGGYGSVRGFDFRGISPRAGPFDDPVGGDFSLAGGEELGFPLVEDFLRGVVFVDAGDVEANTHFGVIRSSAGLGVRLYIPFFGQKPVALDFGIPISQNRQDRTQVLSFSLGISR